MSGFSECMVYLLSILRLNFFKPVTHITADIYNVLQIILVFLTDVPKPIDKRKVKTLCIQDL